MICFTFSSGFPVIFHLERWGIVRNKDRRKCSFTRLQMYQSRQRIGGKTEYAVEKKFERRASERAEGIIAAAVGVGRRREPFKCKESNHGTKPPRRTTLARSRMDGWMCGCAARPPSRGQNKVHFLLRLLPSFLALRGTRNKDIAPSIERDSERERVR